MPLLYDLYYFWCLCTTMIVDEQSTKFLWKKMHISSLEDLFASPCTCITFYRHFLLALKMQKNFLYFEFLIQMLQVA